MAIRLFLRSDRDRAQRGPATRLVQEARLDLIGRPAVIALVLLGAMPAHAQDLLPNQPLLSSPPLTTLLQPQRLDRSKPLLPQSTARTPGTPCERPGAAAGTGYAPRSAASAPTPGRAATGGSGPGEYGRYMPGALAPGAGPSTPGAKPAGADAASPGDNAATGSSSKPATAARGVDKPLYGGIDRPLWNTGEQRARADGDAAADKSAAAATSPESGAAFPRDRPLWADGNPAQPGGQLTGAAAVAAAGLGLSPCRADSAPLSR